YIPKLLNDELGILTNKLMEKSGLSITDIDYYAIHPGGVAILKACEKALNLTREQNSFSYNILNNFGNMSSVTVLFVLKEMLQNVNDKDKGKNVLSFAFGPGLTMESMILKIA
ncbi:MAG: type III polyketide synthase, partial [Bacteroidetes bacterium]|nr:type III polyketide synthase [Bacteroidota bacterium]